MRRESRIGLNSGTGRDSLDRAGCGLGTGRVRFGYGPSAGKVVRSAYERMAKKSTSFRAVAPEMVHKCELVRKNSSFENFARHKGVVFTSKASA